MVHPNSQPGIIIPNLFLLKALWHVGFDAFNDHIFHHVKHHIADIVSLDDVVAKTVELFTLLIHHVVIFQSATTNLVMVLLHAFLGTLDGAVEKRMGNFLVLFHAHFLQHASHLLTVAITPHQVVLEAEEEVRASGIALTRTTAAQLAIDPA